MSFETHQPTVEDVTVQARAQRIRLLLMDCDGVLTDGRIVLLPDKEDTKFFHAHDGQGMKLAALAGLRTGVITTRTSHALERRVKEMHAHHLYQNAENKLLAYEAILAEEGISDEAVAYIGDDLPDLPVMRRVGLAIAVANAVAEVKAHAHWVTRREGGHGGVREAIEFILKAQGKWDQLVASFGFARDTD
ncbi:MAG: HAD hydrolase family protein [Acidobacteriota bacterium]|nr:HAD hydrolase family protein [Blastocatellia bacterium]MDW8238120.1 HAD hydrolase family protein [Acidobacteriota bacterium]